MPPPLVAALYCFWEKYCCFRSVKLQRYKCAWLKKNGMVWFTFLVALLKQRPIWFLWGENQAMTIKAEKEPRHDVLSRKKRETIEKFPRRPLGTESDSYKRPIARKIHVRLLQSRQGHCHERRPRKRISGGKRTTLNSTQKNCPAKKCEATRSPAVKCTIAA